jgi:hypothetical protein
MAVPVLLDAWDFFRIKKTQMFHLYYIMMTAHKYAYTIYMIEGAGLL